jgi:hypothetical protein
MKFDLKKAQWKTSDYDRLESDYKQSLVELASLKKKLRVALTKEKLAEERALAEK